MRTARLLTVFNSVLCVGVGLPTPPPMQTPLDVDPPDADHPDADPPCVQTLPWM